MKRPDGGDNRTTVDNVHGDERPAGNSEAAALRRLRKDDPALHVKVIAGEAIRLAAVGRPTDEQKNKGSNRTIIRGTTVSYTAARLKRDRPDLAARVISGELSANKAAILAGIRSRARPRVPARC
jgi:hypothetical protein